MTMNFESMIILVSVLHVILNVFLYGLIGYVVFKFVQYFFEKKKNENIKKGSRSNKRI